MRSNGLVVAIDGPSGAGKSTAGRNLSALLGYMYIDTGAMYRALALKASRSGVSLDSEEALAALCRASSIQLSEGGRRVLLDGYDVTADVRSREISRASSLVSVHPGVRVEMVARQREMGRDGGVVLDGRDIGTAVFPDAEVKFFLDANPGERAGRRLKELQAAGNDVSFDTVERMLAAVRAREGRPLDLARLAEQHLASPRRYLEALRGVRMSVGLYKLRKGQEDEQTPHPEEEAYLVLEGRGRFRMGDEDVEVGPGHVFTVPARVEHRFHSIEQDMLMLVLFAPPEGSAADDE